MATTTKMTQKDYFNEIIALAKANGRDDLVEFAKGRIEILDRKSSNKKATKTQKANEEIKAIILNVLNESNAPMTVTEILSTGSFEQGTTNQKISALLRQLVLAEKVTKTIEKKVSRFSVK